MIVSSVTDHPWIMSDDVFIQLLKAITYFLLVIFLRRDRSPDLLVAGWQTSQLSEHERDS